MPHSVIRQLLLGKQRQALGEIVIRLLESARDDYFPGEGLVDFLLFVLILVKMYDINELGRLATASALSRSVGLPRTTMQRKLARLKRMGAIQQRGSRFMLSPSYLNNPQMLLGFKRRVNAVRDAPKKLTKVGT
jgi:hypothetical protein